MTYPPNARSPPTLAIRNAWWKYCCAVRCRSESYAQMPAIAIHSADGTQQFAAGLVGVIAADGRRGVVVQKCDHPAVRRGSTDLPVHRLVTGARAARYLKVAVVHTNMPAVRNVEVVRRILPLPHRRNRRQTRQRVGVAVLVGAMAIGFPHRGARSMRAKAVRPSDLPLRPGTCPHPPGTPVAATRPPALAHQLDGPFPGALAAKPPADRRVVVLRLPALYARQVR
ncbi:hypothetical protein ACU686_37980 [Yinghuangia aomiensis]